MGHAEVQRIPASALRSPHDHLALAAQACLLRRQTSACAFHAAVRQSLKIVEPGPGEELPAGQAHRGRVGQRDVRYRHGLTRSIVHAVGAPNLVAMEGKVQNVPGHGGVLAGPASAGYVEAAPHCRPHARVGICPGVEPRLGDGPEYLVLIGIGYEAPVIKGIVSQARVFI